MGSADKQAKGALGFCSCLSSCTWPNCASDAMQSAHKAQKRPKRGGKASGAAVENGAPPEPEKAAREFKETPAFLKGGDLYPYQLEGLNWCGLSLSSGICHAQLSNVACCRRSFCHVCQ